MDVLTLTIAVADLGSGESWERPVEIRRAAARYEEGRRQVHTV